MDSRKENSAAASLFRPKSRAPAMVEPLRETPGRMAIPCMAPMPMALTRPICWMSSPLDLRRRK